MFLKNLFILLVFNFVISDGKSTLSQSPTNYWDDTERFGLTGSPSPDLRLPSHIVPSFYRLKIMADLENSNFSGEVYITIRASQKAKQIILHSKNLRINNSSKLSELIYEKVETLHARRKRQLEGAAPTDSNQNNATGTVNNTETINTNQSLQNVTSGNQTVDDEAAKNETSIPPIAINTPAMNNTELENKPAAASNVSVPVDNTTQPVNANETDTKVSQDDKSDNNRRKMEETMSTTKLYNSTLDVTVTTRSSSEKVNVRTAPIDSGTQVTHSSIRNIKIISIQEELGDRLVLTLATALKPDVDYTLELSFTGNITDSMTGFYRSNYLNSQLEEKKLGVTQFEPTSARAAFPCFDEPAFKAQFEISIGHRANVSVLSNMEVSSTELMPEKPDWTWTHFERSVKMSTYLVAFIISNFKSVETTYLSHENITKTIRVWTRPELINKTKYSLAIAPKLLEYYEDVFGVPYVLNKVDLVGIPDFSSGAMENWGLVTFRETTLLFDETEGVPRDKQVVAIDVAHELAHQWFGNLVTMQWWTDLWLNEGFATYIEYVGVDHIEPEWNMLESFTRDKMDLLRSDALKNTSPVSMKVIDASEISQKFDEISYSKGASLIRMLNHTISEELFHKGLALYLNQWKYSNAEENDLWEAMTTVTKSDPVLKDRSLVAFMNSWTRQAGYPVVKVLRNYETGGVVFEQHLFTSSNEPYQHMAEQTWQIPISWTTMDAPLAQWTTKPKLWLTDRTANDVLNINASQPLYVNVDAIGYYRVNYDSRNWELLSKALKSGHVKSAIAKAQLIDDAFNLAKASQLDYSLALGLTTYVIDGEDSKIVWDLLLNNMGFLKATLKATPGYVYFQDYMKILLKKQLEKLNYGLNKPKDDNEAFLIENLLAWECSSGSTRCLKWAREQFDAWSSQPDWTVNPIPSYLRPLVYNIALKYGGRQEFDFLWKVFSNSTDPNVKSIIVNSLPATREESLIAMLLEKSLTELPKQYAVSAWILEPPVGPPIARSFLINNFDRIYNRFTAMDPFTFPSVLNGAFGFINTQKELDLLKQFALEHKEKLLPMSVMLQKLVDTATMRIEWIKTHADHITQWFKDYGTADKPGSSTYNATRRSDSDSSSQPSNATQKPNDGAPNTKQNDAPVLNLPQNEPNSNLNTSAQNIPSVTNNTVTTDNPSGQNNSEPAVQISETVTNSTTLVSPAPNETIASEAPKSDPSSANVEPQGVANASTIAPAAP